MKLIKLLAATLLAASPLAANAHGGWYAGLDVGGARTDAQIDEYVFFGATTDRASSSTTGFRLRGGYQFGRFFALEVAYVDFGQFENHFDPDDCPNGAPGPCPFDARTSISGVVGTLVGVVPLGEHWFATARAGYGNLEVKTEEIGAAGLDGASSSGGFHYGIGAGHHFNEHWEVSVDYSAFDQMDFGFGLGGDFGVLNLGETTLTSLGISYRW